MEDMNAPQLGGAPQFATGAGGIDPNLGVSAGGDDEDIPELEAPEEDGPVDETGVDPKDIELVMTQVNCTRAKAVRALKESGGDLINASTLPDSFIPICSLMVLKSYGCERVILRSVDVRVLACTLSRNSCFLRNRQFHALGFMNHRHHRRISTK